MNKKRNIYDDASLIERYLLDETREGEETSHGNLTDENAELRTVADELSREGRLEQAFCRMQRYSSEKAFRSFLHRIGESERSPMHRFIGYGKYIAAAMVVLAVGVGIYLSSQEDKPYIIQPGTSQAQLTLPNGEVVDINKEDVDVKADGVWVRYQKGVLSYIPEDTTTAAETTSVTTPAQPNELIIPKGGENTVVLSDGTTVCLNAGSRLVFPARFIGQCREVFLEGEGFFEVSPDHAHPFVVKTRLGETTVLGTAFNVSAYAESNACLITLVRGKVRCKSQGGSELLLHPGEQAVTTEDGIESKPVDVDEYIGWVKGLYTFKHRSLGDIMDTFGRWYDVDIDFEDASLRDISFSGNVKRYESLNTFLNALQLTGRVDFRIEKGKVVICSPTSEEE